MAKLPEQKQNSSGVQTPVVWPSTLHDSLHARVAFNNDHVHLLLVFEDSQRLTKANRNAKPTKTDNFIVANWSVVTAIVY